MSRISSLTDTIGLRSPQSCEAPGRTGAGGAGAREGSGVDLEDEHASVESAMTATSRQERQEGREGQEAPVPPVLPFLPDSIIYSPSSDRAAASAAGCWDRAARPFRGS